MANRIMTFFKRLNVITTTPTKLLTSRLREPKEGWFAVRSLSHRVSCYHTLPGGKGTIIGNPITEDLIALNPALERLAVYQVTQATSEAPTPIDTITSTESATGTIAATTTTFERTSTAVETTSVVVAACPAPSYAVCSGECMHTKSDSNSCDACENICVSRSCVNGVYAATPAACLRTHNCASGSSAEMYPACSSRPGYRVSYD
ncbi:hypothetical protein ABW19_dt0209020 [Dactylella cylindrospora]|nr:hypothetical protein ABW19_dt0209020 [Dactylella cylindrospora]